MASVLPSTAPPRPAASRITVLDALRGSALLGLFLLHNVEHFDLGGGPATSPGWLQPWDAGVRAATYVLFAGKAYAIFAFLFGLSFYLILTRWTERGIAAGPRFLRRLGLLALFGYLHGIVYCGDILLVLAIVGTPLVWLNRLPSRWLAVIAIMALLQPTLLWQRHELIQHPPLASAVPYHWDLYGAVGRVYANGTLGQVTLTNLWAGQWPRLWFSIESGRVLQMLGLFLGGLLLGRSGALHDDARLTRFAWRAVIIGLLGWLLAHSIEAPLLRPALLPLTRTTVEALLGAYHGVARAAIWAGAFTLLYLHTPAKRALTWLEPVGRLSLTAYVTQALICVPIYYHYGLGRFRVWGPAASVLFGIGLFVTQSLVARWWLTRHDQGPLEWLWRRGTLGRTR